MRAMNRRSMILGIAVMLGTTACGNNGRNSGPTDTPAAATTITEATTAGTTPPDTNGSGNGGTYATRAFNLPFDLTVPTWLEPAPSVEQPNFVTWVASGGTDRAVRFLIPVNVYPPGSTGTTPTPIDYVAYLLGQADHGAHFSDEVETTVDGRQATIVTATADDNLDGSLGCPDHGIDAADCMGLQPDLVLRIAVIDTGDETLLAWLKGYAGADMTAETESFAQLLTTLRFSNRPVEAPAPSTIAAAVATSLDGTYRWTITADDALAHGTPDDKTPESQATFPWVFTLTMSAGTAHLVNRAGDGESEGRGSYTVEGDRVVFDWGGGNVATYTVRVDGDGTLHVAPQGAMDPGDVFVMATHPWTKIGGGSDDAAAAGLDGTYRWTLTKDDALTHGLPGDKTPESQATFPWAFTMTMSAGSWHLVNRAGDGESDAGRGTYTVEGDHVVFTEDDERFDFVYTVDADGMLHLDPQPPINPGTAWVFATNPWAKID